MSATGGVPGGPMNIGQMRTRLAGAAAWLAQRPYGHISWTCAPCNRLYVQIEAWSLAYDMAMSAMHHRPTDAAQRALDAKVAWA